MPLNDVRRVKNPIM